MAIRHTEILPELITISILTELADSIQTSLHITTRLRDIRPCIALTRLARWSVEASEFVCFADDWLVVDCDAQEAFEEVVEGREPVHPFAPEGGEGLGGDDDAAEGDDKEEEEGD